MDAYQLALLIGAAFAALASWKLPRSNLWISAGAAAFILSTAWARYSLPFPPAFTLACDSGVCLVIYFFCKEKWEIGLYRLFQLSALIDLLYLTQPFEVLGFHFQISHYSYVVALELVNWAALFLIGGTSVADRIYSWAHEISSDYRRKSINRGALPSWRESRAKDPFHKVP